MMDGLPKVGSLKLRCDEGCWAWDVHRAASHVSTEGRTSERWEREFKLGVGYLGQYRRSDRN